VTVHEQRRLARSSEPIAVDERVAITYDQLDVVHTGGAELFGDESRGAQNVRMVGRIRADAWDTKKVLQIFEVFHRFQCRMKMQPHP
jgi:hypothetical protein